jgi:hypothetical protein
MNNLDKFTIQFKAIAELIGSPKEHVDETLKLYLDNIKKSPKFKFEKVTFYEAEKQEKTGMFSAFAEMELKTESVQDLIGFCFDYMPSSIEIIKPFEFKMKSNEITNFLNDLQDRLHKVEMHSKDMSAQQLILRKQMVQLIRHAIKYNLKKEKSLTEDELIAITGIEKESLNVYLDALVKKGELKKDEDNYSMTKNFKD